MIPIMPNIEISTNKDGKNRANDSGTRYFEEFIFDLKCTNLFSHDIHIA